MQHHKKWQATWDIGALLFQKSSVPFPIFKQFFHLKIWLRTSQSPHDPYHFIIIILLMSLIGHKMTYFI